MTKKILYVLLVLLVIFVAVYFAFPKKEKILEEAQTPAITYVNASDNLIKVDLPFPGAVTGKEFKVIGQARGYWFFEASFPIEVLDKDGKILAKGIAKAGSNWMTEEFVPFSADIKVPATYIGPATLILRKDNPSDIRERDAHISFPFTIEY